ncbi:XRE family transcriptional regulator [Enterococcus mediterraneensis]|uniref:XRE family transcriptional regulator n=1 Tax=Enterococcus mediterraneensis TaxID=2364791 RepID=UPI001F1549CA|nr:XRE family transcriptional regulator [Enterococcus mediterraneensis]
MPSIDNLIMLSDFYDVSIDELIQGSPYFRKPFLVGKKFTVKKGLLLFVIWVFISLFLTGFGVQPFGVLVLVLLVGLLMVFPTVFTDYWVIHKDYLEICQYSQNSLKKCLELLKRTGRHEQIPYSAIKTIEIVYTKKERLSPFDFNPDFLYLRIILSQTTIKLDLASSPRAYLPQFCGFLVRNGVEVIDQQEIVSLLVADQYLYDAFHVSE